MPVNYDYIKIRKRFDIEFDGSIDTPVEQLINIIRDKVEEYSEYKDSINLTFAGVVTDNYGDDTNNYSLTFDYEILETEEEHNDRIVWDEQRERNDAIRKKESEEIKHKVKQKAVSEAIKLLGSEGYSIYKKS